MKFMSDELVETLGNSFRDQLRERRHFEADRVNDHGRRITYMAHGNGWVMCRRPGCIPMTCMEKEWRAMALYVKD